MPNNLPAESSNGYISAVYMYAIDQVHAIQTVLAGIVRSVNTILATYLSGPSSVSVGSIPVFASTQVLDESAVSISGNGVIEANDAKIDMSEDNTIDIVATIVKVNGVQVSSNGDLTVYMPKSGGVFTGPITLSQIVPTTSAGISIPGRMTIFGARPVCSGGYSMTTNPAELKNSTVETSIIGTGSGTLTLLANAFTVGGCSRAFMGGDIDTTGSPTITFRVYVGPTSSTLLVTFVIPLTSITLVAWRLEVMLTCRALGSGTTGKLQMNSFFVLHDTTNASTWVSNPLADIDTTVANTFRVTAQWSVASASNILRVNTFNTFNMFHS
jgi:uncharacterized Zn-binding protein involved in type VI secretion